VREHGALGLPGRPRRVADDGHVVARAPRDLLVEPARVLPVELLAALLQRGQAQQAGLLVLPHAAGVFVDDVLEAGALRAHVQELVHLLLILDHREPHLRVVHDVLHLLLDRVLVQRHGHAADRLGGQHSPVERRAIVADDGGLVAARETERGQPERDQARLGEVVAPAVRLPDAEGLLANGHLPRRRWAPEASLGRYRGPLDIRYACGRIARGRARRSSPAPLERVFTLVRLHQEHPRWRR
jgi:hypothetical protein